MSEDTIDINSKALWEKAINLYLAALSSENEKSQVKRYLSMITSVAKEDNSFIVYTSTPYAADFLKTNYADKLMRCLEIVSDDNNLNIIFKVNEDAKPAVVTHKNNKSQVKTTKVSNFVSTLPLNEDYTFDEFVRGPSNSFAVAAAEGTVKNHGKPMYNPLFIYGGSGLGKTHLMQAVGNELKKNNPSLAICYLTAEAFMNEYINNMTNKTIQSFRNKYRTVDVLLLDDVQFFQRGKDTQEEFFNTFCALKDAKKQIVMTSDVAPKDLPAIEERLVTRFQGGIVQEIESPGYETRLAILKKKVEVMNIHVPDFILEFIADNIKSHVRALEGALGKICLHINAFPNTLLNEEMVAYMLKDFIAEETTKKKLTIEQIQSTVCKKYGVSMTQILSSERTQSIVTPRQLAMYIARKYTTNSLLEIARKFEKEHATIIHGVKTISKRLDVENDLKSDLAEILAEFEYKISDILVK